MNSEIIPSNMEVCGMFVLLAIFIINTSDCEFTATPGTISGCNNSDVTLSWTILSYASVSTVQWKKQGTTIMSQSGPGTPTLSAGVTNAEHGGDGAIIIKGVQCNDDGEYSCHITYPPVSSYLASSSTATLSISVPPSYPPILETVEAENSMTHTCNVTTKGTPEVTVTIKVGEEEKSTATHSVSCDNHDDISCCITGDAFDCLSGTERCVKLGGASDCVLKAGSIVVILFSVILVIVVITMLWICLFRRLPSFGGCDRMRITWRYFKAWNGLTLLRATILVTVVAVVFDVFILVMTIYILCWCIDCEDKCTLDRCSDTWREDMLIFCGCCLGFLYIVIIILAILCNKHSGGEIAILHAGLSEERNTGQNRTKKDHKIRPHPSLKPN